MTEPRGASSRLHINTTWPPKGRARRTVLGLAAATAAAGTIMVLSAAGGSGVAGAAPSQQGKITLCHRTNSNHKPYIVITVAPNSISHRIFGKNGHNTHNGPVWNPTLKAAHIRWGDIIPPFDWKRGHYAGKNWPAGEPIQENNCNIPGETTPPTTPGSTPPTTPESTPPTTPESTPPTTPESTPPTTPESSIVTTSEQTTPTSNGPIPSGVSAGLHTPVANAGMKAWGTVLMLLGGAAGLLAGLWPTRRRAH